MIALPTCTFSLQFCLPEITVNDKDVSLETSPSDLTSHVKSRKII